MWLAWQTQLGWAETDWPDKPNSVGPILIGLINSTGLSRFYVPVVQYYIEIYGIRMYPVWALNLVRASLVAASRGKTQTSKSTETATAGLIESVVQKNFPTHHPGFQGLVIHKSEG